MRSITLTNTFKIALGTFFLSMCAVSSTAYASDPVYSQVDSPRIFSPVFCGAVFGSKQIDGTYTSFSGYSALIKNPERLPLGTQVCSSPTTDTNWIGAGSSGEYIDKTNYGINNFVNIAQQYGDGKYFFYSNAGAPNGTWGFVHAYASSTPIFYDTVEQLNATSQSTPTPTATTQYIQILSPEYGTTTSNFVELSVHFRTPLSFDFRPTTTRTIVIRDAVTLLEDWRYEETLQAEAGENITVTPLTTSLSNGSKMIFAYYSLENGTIYSEVAQSFFNVNINSYQIATGLTDPQAIPTETQNDCTTFDVGCQFQKAIMFLFYPSQAVLDRFSSLWQNVATKKPFGYVTMTIDALTNLDTNSAHAFDVGEVPFQTAIFDPFKLALGSILWAVYAIYFYQRRLKHLDI